MLNTLLLLPFLVIPVLHIITFVVAKRQDSSSPRFFKWIQSLNYLNIGVSFYAIGLLINQVSMEAELFSSSGLGLSLRIDRLNVILLTMISIIGLVVSRFSSSYLEGDKRQLQFLGNITGVIGSIQLFVLSENLLSIFAAWVITSLFLQQLLTFYPHREKAQLAARKKFILARLGDATLFTAFALLYFTFKTGDLSTILEHLHHAESFNQPALHCAAVLLAITAILKSAQLPFHCWLIEVMEAPTPVSALLHAGLINAGPYLIIRFSPLIQFAESAQITLFAIGMTTAIFGAFVFIYQPAVKTSLGYSSVAHMGFTILLCGIGAYSAALLHLVAHSFYKAHAFLSSGSEVEKSSGTTVKKSYRSGLNRITGFLFSLIACISIGKLTGILPGDSFAQSVLFIFISIAVSAMISYSAHTSGYKSFLRIILSGVFSLASFLIFEAIFQQLTDHELPGTTESSYPVYFAILVMLAIFSGLIALHAILPDLFKNLRHKLTVHLRNGLYINLFINRLMGAYRK